MKTALTGLLALVPTDLLARLLARSVERVSHEDDPLTKLATGWGQLGALLSIFGLGLAVGALVWQTARAEMLGLSARGVAKTFIVRILIADACLLGVLVVLCTLIGTEVKTIAYTTVVNVIAVAFSTSLALVALRRRGPLRLNGTSASVGLIIAGAAVYFRNADVQLEPLRTLCMSAGGMLFFLSLRSIHARERHKPTDQAALPGVLYLRAFAYEGLYYPHPTRGPVLFDEFIGDEIRARIGPFFALGNPVDAIPVGGALRRYAHDHDWQEQFARALGHAAAIVVLPGPSAHLNWELDRVVSAGLATRLFVVNPPPTQLAQEQSTWAFRVARWVAELLRIPSASAPRVTRTDEQRFMACLRERGFHGVPDVLPVGSVLAFDEERSTLVLTQNQASPDALAWAIEHRLQSLAPLPPPRLEAAAAQARRSLWYWVAHAWEEGFLMLQLRMRRPVLSYFGYLALLFVSAWVSQLFRQCTSPEQGAEAARARDVVSAVTR